MNPEMSIDDLKSALLKKKSELKIKSNKPSTKVKNGQSESGNMLMLSQTNKDKQHPKLVHNEKKLIQTEKDKKGKSLKEPVFFFLQDGELSAGSIDPNCTTATISEATETEEVSTTEDMCVSTTVCIDLSADQETSAPCRKTSIICIDLLEETEKELVDVGEPENVTEVKKLDGFESMSQNAASEEVFKLAVEDATTEYSTEVTTEMLQLVEENVCSSTTEEITTICKDDSKKHELESSVGSSDDGLQDLLNKNKIHINLDINKIQNDTDSYYKSAGGNGVSEGKPHAINGSIRFIINNNTDADVFLDGSEELEFFLPAGKTKEA